MKSRQWLEDDSQVAQTGGLALGVPCTVWRRALAWIFWLAVGAFALSGFAEQRFPPPEFESGHQLPATTVPGARAFLLGYLDVAVLAGSLALATWLVLKKRVRKGVVALSIFSLIYFGFWRKGCVCSIGSFQNLTLALFDKGYQLPAAVTAFFVLPLAFALFAGRTFCAAICPHGALQDLVLLKPLKVPAWLENALGLLPYVYLGAGVLFAATGSTFLVCQYDPFVPIFRMNGRIVMVLAGVGLLFLGVFVGRPYCRFLCPYGALLKLGATVSKWRVRVTPDVCTQCRLCEASCPFGALREPTTADLARRTSTGERKRLGWCLILLPVLVFAGVWLGGRFGPTASRMHPAVRLAEKIIRAPAGAAVSAQPGPDELELERGRATQEAVLSEAAFARKKFDMGGRIFGGWLGLVVGVKLVGLSLRRMRHDYEPARGDCVACARCFDSCPNERLRRGLVPAGANAALTEGESCA